MLHHPFCVEMRHYFYTNGDKANVNIKIYIRIARWSIFKCRDGLHSWNNLQDYEILFENEVNGSTTSC
jgi:hypothetical protein